MPDISINDPNYNSLIQKIGDRYAQGRAAAVNAVNHELVLTYWEIGRYIVEFEQDGKTKAAYGKALLKRLSADLSAQHGKGFSRMNLQQMRKLYVTWPKRQTLSNFFSWSHFVELMRIKSPTARSFYEQQTIIEKWSVRELKRQKDASALSSLKLSARC